METSIDVEHRYDVRKARIEIRRLTALIDNTAIKNPSYVIPGSNGQMRYQIEDRIAKAKMKLFVLGKST